MVKTDLSAEQTVKLNQLAKHTAELKPWEFIPANRLFAVRLPGSVESAYIQIIGQMGEEFGILAFVGEESLHRLHGMSSGGDITELRILALSYDLPDNMSPLFDHKDSEAVNIGSRRFFPAFTSHIPGRSPWLLSASEANQFEQYLLQALEVLTRRNAGGFIDLDGDLGLCLYRTHLIGQWVDSVETVPPDPRKNSSFIIPPDLLKTLWKMPLHTHGFQAELCRMPSPYGSMDDRGVFPYLLLIVDEEDGYAFHELVPSEPTLRKMELSIPGVLLQIFCEIGLKPARLTVPEDGKLHSLIKEMGSENLPFPVRAVEDPEPVTEILDSFWESVLRKSSADGMLPDEEEAVYQIKVALMHDKSIYRKIAIGSGQTLEDLHDAIFDAFDREEEHLYTFFFPGKPTTSKRVIMQSPAYSPPMEDDFLRMENDEDSTETTIGELNLKLKQKFYYLFDWGDEWWHELTFEGEIEFSGGKLPEVTMAKGKSPRQYPDWEEDDDDEDEE